MYIRYVRRFQVDWSPCVGVVHEYGTRWQDRIKRNDDAIAILVERDHFQYALLPDSHVERRVHGDGWTRVGCKRTRIL